MQVRFISDPFPHIIVEDYFSDLELVYIWKELNFLSSPGKLRSAKETRSAFTLDSNGNQVLSKNNSAIWLDTIYSDRNLSDILKYGGKLFDRSIIDPIANGKKEDWFFRYLLTCNQYGTLLSYYQDGGYYRPHFDHSLLTTITHLFIEPRLFEGGELKFPDFDLDLGLKNNRMIVFPSIINHSVSEIKAHSTMPGTGRYTISQFLTINMSLDR